MTEVNSGVRRATEELRAWGLPSLDNDVTDELAELMEYCDRRFTKHEAFGRQRLTSLAYTILGETQP